MEIEGKLDQVAGIKKSVVVCTQDQQSENYLTAYYVVLGGDDAEIDENNLVRELKISLPGYMIPGAFYRLDRFPHTPTGKIDRKALADSTEYHSRDRSMKEYAAPAKGIETALADIWKELLQVERVSVHDNFFVLGGNSLKAIMVTSHLHKALNVKLPLAEIFKRPTIKELSLYIKRAGEDKYASIAPVEEKEYYALSSAQKRLYFLQQMDVKSTGYNMPLMFPLGKDIEKERLESTLKKLIKRHESLRTSFIMVADEPVQRVFDKVEFDIEDYGMEGRGEPLCSPLQGEEIINNFIRPFDLTKVPLLRAGVIKLTDGNHTWIVDMHHIISDGTSRTVLTEDFMALYNGEKLATLRIQYKDFSAWQNRLFEDGMIKAQEEYWLKLYSAAREIPRLSMATDYKRPEVFTLSGSNYGFTLEGEEAIKFRALAFSNGATLYMNILAALNTLFYKYTGQTDIIIGSGIAGRPHADLQRIIGMFVNTLAMRNHPGGEKTYQFFLKEVIAHSVDAFENQDVQFEELVDKLDLERDPSRNPLFDISMVVQNFRPVGEGFPDLPAENVKYENTSAKFDVTFFVFEQDEDVYINIEYYSAIFKAETIERLVSHLKNIVKTVGENPAVKLKDIAVISEEEKKQVLYEFNDTAGEYPQDKTIHQLFAEQVEETPNQIAARTDTAAVTYKVLNAEANRLARYLLEEKGLRPGDRVGILMSPSLYRPVSILGVLKAGGIYVPIDPSLPHKRVEYMITDASIGAVVSERKYLRALNRWQWEIDCFHSYLCIDSDDIHGEDEMEPNELMDEELWRHVGETAADDITGGGWVSSYTGEPMSRQEMDEYGDNILEKLAPLLHEKMRVLEIGTASGLTMYRIAPEVGLYYGTDLSRVIIEKNKRRIEKEGYRNIKLSCLPAHEIGKIEERNFDLVIMNSVIQCFHGHNYLRKVIRQCIDLLGENGCLFIGDVMDQEKKETLVRELTAFKYAHVNKYKGYSTKTDFSAELFVPREFWEDLGAESREVEEIECSEKIHTIKNELTGFRYDVLMTVDKTLTPFKNKKRKKRKYQDDRRTLCAWGSEAIHLSLPSSSPAYIIYTSGTTGTPRGVMITQRSLVNLACWHNRNYTITPADNATLYAGFGFDASVWELFPYLIKGSTLHIPDEAIKLDTRELNDYYERNHITVGFLPTQMCEQFMDMERDNRSLRILLTGGDKLRTYNLDVEKRGYDLYNNYGPTENTVVTTSYLVERPPDNIPIGKPIDNNRVYILNKESLQLQPIGVPGELCISGAGLAMGYLNHPELTAKKFMPQTFTDFTQTNFSKKLLRGVQGGGILEKSPHGRRRQPPAGAPYKRTYKTGDLCRWLADGNIQFLGRIDQQVKIRGFRIELGEIENRLMKHREIKDAVVIEKDDGAGSNYLCAYVVGCSSPSPKAAELKEYLSLTLPGYMIPSYFVFLERIPLTPNGKVNRRKLPAPGITAGGKYSVPSNRVEKKLVEIWSEVLNTNGHAPHTIGIDGNFFELGGHSLKATVLVAKIHKELDVKVPLAEVFKTPTIRGLSGYIKELTEDKFASIEPVEKKDYYALSSAQKRLYILQRMDLESTAYNMPEVVPVEQDINREKLAETFNKIIKRHESFRTCFEMVTGEPVQRIHSTVDSGQWAVDGRGEPLCSPGVYFHHSSFIIHHSVRHFIRPFDLSRAPLLRAGMINSRTLLVDMHHIIADGVSHDVLVRDFTALYNGEELIPLRIQYRDFSEWQNNPRQKEAVKQQEAYWLKAFAGEIPLLNLPLDYPRPAVQGFEGNRVIFMISVDETETLKQVALEQGTTLYMLLLTAFFLLLSKISGQEDIVVGSPAAGRRHADLDHIIGMFVNTLALRNYPNGRNFFSQFLGEVKESTLEAFENQDYPFEDLVDQAAVKRDPGRHPLFDIMFTLLDTAGGIGEEVEERELEEQTLLNESVKFDLCLDVTAGENLFFTLRYCTKLFKEETIRRLAGYFKRVLLSIAPGPEANTNPRLSEMEIISPEEKQRILVDFNDTGDETNYHDDSEYPGNKTIHRLFEEQAGKTPCSIAVVGYIKPRSTRRVFITYKEIDRQADNMARVLRAKGVSFDSVIGIKMERSLDMIIGILAILKAGGAYLPISPNYPEERIDFMLRDSSAKVLVSSEVEVIDLCRGEPLCSPEVFLHHSSLIAHHSANLAYILYTSGSTGRPKGVLVEHRNVVRLVKHANFIDFLGEDRLLMTGAIEFDVTTFEIWGPLLNGACLHLPREEVVLYAEKLKKAVVENKISLLHLVPQLFDQVAVQEHEIFAGLRCFFVGGDLVRPRYINMIRGRYKHLKIVHLYGPTENTAFSTFFPIDKDYETRIPIGKPISKSLVYIVDKYNQLQPIGVAGELYVGGVGVARGYLNQPELTAEKYTPQTFTDFTQTNFSKKFCRGPGGGFSIEPLGRRRLYKTGDLARWLPDGNIEFLGRIDLQVKIRGNRIELGEIENRLLKYPNIKEAVVIAKDKNNGEKYLCAYISPFNVGPGIDTATLKDFLSRSLPGYMVPDRFVEVDEIPLTLNGKIDRKKLPEPEFFAVEDYVPPQNETEEKLAEIWAGVLGLETVGTASNFFDLGGNSLSLIKMHARVKDCFGKDIPVTTIFQLATIAALAKYIREEEASRQVSEDILDESVNTMEETLNLLGEDDG